jgi:hypothetical protein
MATPLNREKEENTANASTALGADERFRTTPQLAPVEQEMQGKNEKIMMSFFS